MTRLGGNRRRVVVLAGLAAVLVMGIATASRGLVLGYASGRLFVAQLSNSSVWSSGEGWVVANPADPRLLTADWTSFPWKDPINAILSGPAAHPIQCGVGYSTDGGEHWVQGVLPFGPATGLGDLPGACVDPTLVVDRNGTLYAMSNGGTVLPGAGTASPDLPSFCCIFSVSRDGGRTWSSPQQVATFEEALKNTLASRSPDLGFDRPWLIIDPVTGTLYASISDDALIERVVFASHDHGATWTTPFPLVPNDQSVWGDVPSAANGVLAAAYSANPNSIGYKLARSPAVRCNRTCAVFETSTNDGKTWARHVMPVAQVAAGGLPTVPGLEVAADPSTTGRFAVLVPVTASSEQLWVTTDSGTTWTHTRTISASGGDTITKPWIAYGPTGALGVVWRDLHHDRSYAVYTAVSTNGGRTFGSPIELAPGTAPADTPPEGTPGDDCACNVYLNSKYLYTTWGDSRSGNLQVWFARYRY